MEIIKKLKQKGIKQKEVAEITGLSNSTISELFAEKNKPSRHIARLFELAFGERQPYINPTIEAVAQIMEQLPPEAQAEVLKAAEKEKVFVEAGRGK